VGVNTEAVRMLVEDSESACRVHERIGVIVKVVRVHEDALRVIM
jgi:hypothetical protein